jgi:biotin carboxylase
MRDDAMVFFGTLPVIARHARALTGARDRGLAPLLVTSGGPAARERYARRRRDPTHPFTAIADIAFLPGPDVDLVLREAARWSERYEIRGALSCGEVFVEQAGVLCDVYGLAGPGLRAARACRNKHLQRRYLPELSPASELVLPAERAAPRTWKGQLVVKPVGRMSSSGVRAVDGAAVRDCLAGYPPDERLLVEQRVHGPEYSVEALVQDGAPVFEGVTAKGTNEGSSPYFTELSHTVPAPVEPGLTDALLAAGRRVIARLDLRDGITHTEFRVDGAGQMVLMEVAARVPGDAITYMYELATGAALEPVLLDIALRRPAAYPAIRRRVRHAYLEHIPGRLTDVVADVAPIWIEDEDRWPDLRPAGPQAPPRTCAVLVWRERGTRLGDLTESDDRSVSVLVDAPLDADIDAAATAARRSVKVLVTPGSVPDG